MVFRAEYEKEGEETKIAVVDARTFAAAAETAEKQFAGYVLREIRRMDVFLIQA